MNRTRQAISALSIAAVTGFGLAACTSASNSSGQQQENQAQRQDTQSLVRNQQIPHFSWSMERQILIDAETAAADGTQSTSFFFIQGVRDPVFVCPSLGLGVPDTAQLSNPQQVVNDGYPNGGQGLTVGQMDPFGVYSPPASEGTYVICVGSGGKPYLERAEEFVHTVLGPAVWDYGTHQIKVTGAPTYNVKVKR